MVFGIAGLVRAAGSARNAAALLRRSSSLVAGSFSETPRSEIRSEINARDLKILERADFASEVTDQTNPPYDFKRALSNNLLSSPVKLVGEPKNPRHNPFAGKLVEVCGDGTLRSLTESKAKAPAITFSAGLACFLNERRVETNLKDAQNFFGPNLKAYVSPMETEISLNVRYKAGMNVYESDENYLNEAVARHFFEHVLKPKFFDSDDKLLPLDKVKDSIHIAHSIAAREGITYARFFRQDLEKRGLPRDEIASYMRKVLMINIASALSLEEADKKELRFPTVSFVGVCDVGGKKPASFFEKVLSNPECFVKPCSFAFGASNIIVTMPPGKVPRVLEENGSLRVDPNGHAPYLYFDAIKNSEFSSIAKAVKEFGEGNLKEDVCAIFEGLKARSTAIPSELSEEKKIEAMKLMQSAWEKDFIKAQEGAAEKLRREMLVKERDAKSHGKSDRRARDQQVRKLSSVAGPRANKLCSKNKSQSPHR